MRGFGLIALAIASILAGGEGNLRANEAKVPRRIHYSFFQSTGFVMVTVQETGSGAKGDVVFASRMLVGTPSFRGAFQIPAAEFEQMWSTLNAPGVEKRPVTGKSIDLSDDYVFRTASGQQYYVPKASGAPAVRALAANLRSHADTAMTGMRQIPPTTVTGAELIDYGIYELKPTGEKRSAPKLASGSWTVTSNPRLVKKTDVIPERLGVSFGVRYRLKGAPEGDLVEITVEVINPPGVLNTRTGKPVPVEQHNVTIAMGKLDYRGIGFETPADLIPGEYKLRIKVGSKVVLEKAFQVVAAAAQ
jgi:hypothetical protein